ncbi:MAG: SDR family oxidoreductase [Phaeodactylibacter sp.]|nr:SDR family oxidoreductase [Phaeodactylibacter sp.]MCB9301720.1 SDR family oxidoreductase [Lewinellaceae bacterium]HQU58035.1 SDR family oxidoreductase [Saprospiraceae bacterium]
MKNIIITGASRGIGYQTALQLAQQGHQVLALSRNEEALQQLKAEAGENLDFLAFDLSKPDANTLLAKVQRLGHVDVLVNNAGLLLVRPFEELTTTDWQHMMAVNLYGPAHLIQILRPFLEKSHGAHILNISSMGGFQGSSKFPGLLGYSTAKAALATLTECLAEEWRDKGIACNCLCLGAVKTEMLAQAFPGYEAPLSSEKMGSFIAYFATEGRHFYNGKVLPVSVSTP